MTLRPALLFLSAGALLAAASTRAQAQTGATQAEAGASFRASEVMASTGYGPSDEEFYIKQVDPYTGSNIRRRVVTSSLPFDKTWSQLTPRQQAIQRALYVQLPADQEPPFPQRGLVGVYGPLSEIIDAYGRTGRFTTTGRLRMAVVVAPDGLPDSVAVYESPDPELARTFGQALVDVRFKPGLCAGKPCRMEFPVTIDLSHDASASPLVGR